MSIDATRWAWEQSVTPAQKLVLLSLADRADEHHQCYPSTTRLCFDTGLHRETVFEAIKSMEELGLIQVIRQLGRGNRFILVGVKNRHQTSMEKPTSRKKQTSPEMPTSTKTPTSQSGKPDGYQYGKPDTESINESINKEPTKVSAFDEFWNTYPKKVGKEAARRAWSKAKPPLKEVMAALAWQLRSEQWRKENGVFIPNPSTYINQGRWQDEPTKVHTSAPPVFKQEQKPVYNPIPRERLDGHRNNMHAALGKKSGA